MAVDPGNEVQAKASLGGELVLPALAAAFTAYYFTSVWDLTWEAKANATVIGVVLLALIAVQGVRVGARILAGGANLGLGTLFAPRRVLGARLAVTAITAGFIVVLPWLGLTLGLFVLVAALMLALREASPGTILLTAGTIAAGAYLLFVALLRSRLPHGPVESLLSVLF